MRIAICILALSLVAEAGAQEQPEMWRKFQDALSKFIPAGEPTERLVEQPTDALAPEDSPEAQREALWESATKLTSDEESDTDTSPQATVTSPHAKEECLDPEKFQPGQVGYLDYFLFKVVDIGPKELYLEGEHSKEPFCLTGVNTEDFQVDTEETQEDTEDLQETQLVVILGNVRVRGTKAYKTQEGDKLTVRVVKLLSPEESDLADAQRALQESDHPVRTWTSKDGKHKIEARFLKFAGGKVHLINSAGKNIMVSPNDLSVADRDYYRALVKKAREDARRKTEPAADADDQEPNSDEAAPVYSRGE